MTETSIRMALRQAALRATRAPSVHNTQPWQFVLGAKTMEIHADRRRQLRVLDPRRPAAADQLRMRAVQRARVAGQGRAPDRSSSASPTRPARIWSRASPSTRTAASRPTSTWPGSTSTSSERRTNRRPFFEEGVPFDIVDLFVDAARSEGAEVFVIERPEHRLATAHLTPARRRDRERRPGLPRRAARLDQRRPAPRGRRAGVRGAARGRRRPERRGADPRLRHPRHRLAAGRDAHRA